MSALRLGLPEDKSVSPPQTGVLPQTGAPRAQSLRLSSLNKTIAEAGPILALTSV